MAVFLGYQRAHESEPRTSSQTEPQGPHVQPRTISGQGLVAEPEFEFPSERPRLKFIVPVESELKQIQRPSRPRGNPITDREMAVDWSRRGPELLPLTTWARLAPFLKHRLGARVPGVRLHLSRLFRRIAQGLPVVTLPRQSRITWASQALIWWDDTPEMFPFARDADWLVRRLKRERGVHGLRVQIIRHVPDRLDLARIPVGVPVLALSAMGQLERAEDTMEAWVDLSRKLVRRGHAFYALTPSPRNRWQARVSDAWPSAVWDRFPRLPRQGSAPAFTGLDGTSRGTERLLDLLAPASRIEPPLLRAARLRLGAEGDVGTEWEAWHHADCWRSVDCFGFIPGEAYETRLRRRGARAVQEPELCYDIGASMAAHHATSSVVIRAEAELRSCLSGPADDAVLEAVVALLRRVVDRLWLLAAEPGSAQVRRSGLPNWFAEMVDRLTPEMRADPAIRALLSQGLALAHSGLETAHTMIPAGIEGELFKSTKDEASCLLSEPVEFVVELAGRTDSALWRLRPTGHDALDGGMVLGRLRTSSRPVHLSFDAPGGRRHSYQLQVPAQPIELPSLVDLVPFTLETEVHRLRFEIQQRPYWASRMGYGPQGLMAEVDLGKEKHRLTWILPHADVEPGSAERQVARGLWGTSSQPAWASLFLVDEFGVVAEFVIEGVTFRFRWIPPGKFLMGSPADEPGRYDNEGPRHPVRLTRGFWLGETPVTQAQWRVVVETARKNQPFWKGLFGGKNQGLNPSPSHFRGPASLPVESVSWEECASFCRLLDTLLPNGPGFGLPNEAQWEYACRAGTESALYTGSIHLRGVHHAPELDLVAWYGGNSGQNVDVSNPFDSTGWSEKQFDHTKAGPHRVGLKQPNSWGLRDMIGNVLEWCQDEWYAYEEGAVVDPIHASGTTGASRVVRGGSWYARARDCRSEFRSRGDPGGRNLYLGFRLAAGQGLGGAGEAVPGLRDEARRPTAAERRRK